MAHLLEHLVFKGTPTPPEHSAGADRARRAPQRHHLVRSHQLLRDRAATDDNLEWALDLEADRMVNSFIAKKDLESEFTVVRNEFEIGENIRSAC
jgi:zinc protease